MALASTDQPSAEVAPETEATTLALALEQIAARAGELDEQPRFPQQNIDSLKRAGVVQLAADRSRCDLPQEIALVRAVAGADASTARILDGHFNGVERMALEAPGELRERDLHEIERGELLLGVWGADPVGAEGPPARIERVDGGALVLRGVKTFCSGAGGVQRALVVARDEYERRRLVYIDAESQLSIDREWYRGSGLRSSESHRVSFLDLSLIHI